MMMIMRRMGGVIHPTSMNPSQLPQSERRTLRTNAEFIVFAVKQAKKAEAFGFTRNECCRNLKTALHQYWQNKTLRLHGQSQKARIPRSEAAMGRPLSDC